MDHDGQCNIIYAFIQTKFVQGPRYYSYLSHVGHVCCVLFKLKVDNLRGEIKESLFFILFGCAR